MDKNLLKPYYKGCVTWTGIHVFFVSTTLFLLWQIQNYHVQDSDDTFLMMKMKILLVMNVFFLACSLIGGRKTWMFLWGTVIDSKRNNFEIKTVEFKVQDIKELSIFIGEYYAQILPKRYEDYKGPTGNAATIKCSADGEEITLNCAFYLELRPGEKYEFTYCKHSHAVQSVRNSNGEEVPIIEKKEMIGFLYSKVKKT